MNDTPEFIRENVELAAFTTLAIGGNARYFVEASDDQKIIDALAFAHRHSIATFVLGGGSNVLIADNGFDGLVIHIATRGIEFLAEESGTVRLTVKAGEDWDAFVRYTVAENLAGLECMSGIPGSVGGTPVQNVGAYGQEVAESIVSVRCLDRRSREIKLLSADDCGFSYRTSIFNSTERDRFIVLDVTYKLVHDGKPKLAYKDLQEEFGTSKPGLQLVRDAVIKIRRSKSMVIDPNDPNSRSAGSFFKNPVVDTQFVSTLVEQFGNVPSFPVDDDRSKIPAAWLIDKAGFEKGFRLGNAGISDNHTLAIVNRGHATAADVIQLKGKIQDGVQATFGIRLQPEPVFVGF